MIKLIILEEPLFALFMAHLIGDYLLQNDWMAQNKKKSTFHCLVHIITYMIPFLFLGFHLSWVQFILIAIQHFITDRTMIVYKFMLWKGQPIFASEPMYPWSVIVMDNILHIVWIWFVFVFI